MNVLLDSVILIDHLNGISGATNYLKAVRGRSAVSVITRAEVLAGSDETGLPAAIELRDCFLTLAIDRDVADLAATLRRTYHWKLPDAFQAALAKRYGLTLATRNRRDFPPDRFDFVQVPYSV